MLGGTVKRINTQLKACVDAQRMIYELFERLSTTDRKRCAEIVEGRLTELSTPELKELYDLRKERVPHLVPRSGSGSSPSSVDRVLRFQRTWGTHSGPTPDAQPRPLTGRLLEMSAWFGGVFCFCVSPPPLSPLGKGERKGAATRFPKPLQAIPLAAA